MENASKALIIAGAILLAIVIISLGLIVINNTRNTVDNANTNEQEIQVFNDKFIHYEGSKNSVQVKSLLEFVIASNQASGHTVTVETKQVTDKAIKVINSSDASTIATVYPTLKTGATYAVTLEYTGGYISKINIKD